MTESNQAQIALSGKIDTLVDRIDAMAQASDSHAQSNRTITQLLDRINVMIDMREGEIESNTTVSSQSLLTRRVKTPLFRAF